MWYGHLWPSELSEKNTFAQRKILSSSDLEAPFLVADRVHADAMATKFPGRLERLPDPDGEIYGNPNRLIHVVLTLWHRWHSNFSDDVYASLAVHVMGEQSEVVGVKIHRYAVMPDHIHMLVAPSETCDVSAWVHRYKNFLHKACKEKKIAKVVWQDSFYERVLRREEEIEIVDRYILNNPVKDGLTSTWDEYPYNGSFVYNEHRTPTLTATGGRTTPV
jgi:REP element-mobilizing transposase RayT